MSGFGLPILGSLLGNVAIASDPGAATPAQAPGIVVDSGPYIVVDWVAFSETTSEPNGTAVRVRLPLGKDAS